MIRTAAIISVILFLTSTGMVSANYANVRNKVNVSTDGDSSSVNVNIKNNINTNSNTSTKKESSTSVYINQQGEGTSSVQVNGEEWKLEGPGEINVNNVNNGDVQGIKTTLTIVPTTEPTVTPLPSPSTEPTDIQESQVLGEQIENDGFFARLNAVIENFFSRFSSFFDFD